MKKLESITYTVKITTQTGLHIGAGDVGIEIGGIDLQVIKDKDGYPYIPGSSLKGKLRSLVEIGKGMASADGSPHKFQGEECSNCLICRAFGVAGILEGEDLKKKIKEDEKWRKDLEGKIEKMDFNEKEEKGKKEFLKNGVYEISKLSKKEEDKLSKEKKKKINKILGSVKTKILEKWFGELLNKIGPTRMIVRDLFLSEDSKDDKGDIIEKGSKTKFDEIRKNGENPLEEKWEVSIDRLKGIGGNPRPLERVPTDTVFEGQIVFRVFDTGHMGKNNPNITRDEEIAEELFGKKDNLLKTLIENDYLGGQGSRGSGQITITFTRRS